MAAADLICSLPTSHGDHDYNTGNSGSWESPKRDHENFDHPWGEILKINLYALYYKDNGR